MTLNAEFKARVLAGEALFGAFIKTPHPIVIEIMAQAGYDFLVLDAEHAPFDRAALDTLMITGRAAGIPLLVRIPVSTPDWLLFVLDIGAAGVMVPHVNTADQARSLAQAMAYGPGGRGYAGTTRAAGYATRKFADHLGLARDETVLVCQIEDPEGAENFAEIAAVPGVDALFVGRADLAVGYGKADFFDPETGRKCDAILGAEGAMTGLYCAPAEDLTAHHAAGARFFVIGSEHTAMKAGAALDRAAFEVLPKG